jgi:DHA1 family bicyclomycin/chloramphenicol resistance-like MFS transporter
MKLEIKTSNEESTARPNETNKDRAKRRSFSLAERRAVRHNNEMTSSGSVPHQRAEGARSADPLLQKHAQATSGWRFILLLAALTTLMPVSLDVALPAFPLIAKALHAPASLVQWTLSSFLLSFGVGQLIVGALSDRYGRRPLLLAGLTVFVLASLACALVSNVVLLIVLRLVEGAGASVGIVCTRAIIRDVQSDLDQAASLQAYVAAVQGFAIMAAPLIGAAILAIAGWRWIFAFLGISGAILMAIVAMRLPETSPRTAHGLLASYGRALRLPRTIPLTGFVTFSTGSYFILLAVSPFLLAGHINVPGALFGVACALVVATFMSARIVPRVGANRLAGAGVGFIAVACLANCTVELLHPSPAGLVATMAIFAFALGVGMPSVFASALADAGNDAGAASGILGSVQMIGAAGTSGVVSLLPWTITTSAGVMVLFGGVAAALSYWWSCVRGERAQAASTSEEPFAMAMATAAEETD